MGFVTACVFILLMVLHHSIGDAPSPEGEESSRGFIHRDINAELQSLKNMIRDQGSTITTLNAALKKTQEETAVQAADIMAMKVQLTVNERELENLKKENKGLEKEVWNLQNRLKAVESEAENLKQKDAAQEERLTANENAMTNLRKEIAERPKVAFSVGLTNAGTVGPFNVRTNLVFTKVFTNVGQAYNSATGVFTAPVKGVYYFRFTALGFLNSNAMSVNLHKNNQVLMHTGAYNTDGHHNYINNAIVLELEAGDVIFTSLSANYKLFDNTNNSTTFSGFLLYPM